MSNIKTMSDAVKIVIDGYAIGHIFHGNELKNDVVKIYPKSQHQYVDTILRMARRHCRESFRTVDHNKSLYEKIYVKPIIEQIREVAPKEDPLPMHPDRPLVQGELFFQGFFVVFLAFALVVATGFVSGRGRPRFPPSRMASMSSLLYSPAEPIYRKGDLFFLCSLLLTATDDIPSSWAISSIVIPSINISLNQRLPQNQVVNSKMSKYMDILLYGCIVNTQKFVNFYEISMRNLDDSLKRAYIYKCPTIMTLKRLPATPEAERHPIGAKGEVYEEIQNHSRIG